MSVNETNELLHNISREYLTEAIFMRLSTNTYDFLNAIRFSDFSNACI